MVCMVCGDRLNISRWSEDGRLKSCPHCSRLHPLRQHVFYAFPEKFGETPARASPNNPNGPQSYCAICRSQQPQMFEGSVLCAHTASVSRQPLP